MATENPTTPAASNNFPALTIVVPENAEIDGDDIEFELGHGRDKVTCCWGQYFHEWRCRGAQETILAHGLLRPEWLPGFPGNNISSQIVVFERDGPRLIHGNLKGARNGHAWLSISRISRVKLYFRYKPPADEQKRIEELIERRAPRKTAVKTDAHQAASYQPQTPGEFRHDCCRLFDTAIDINHRRAEESGFTYSDESLRRINLALGELRLALAEGGVVPAKPLLQRDGNVVYLTPHPGT